MGDGGSEIGCDLGYSSYFKGFTKRQWKLLGVLGIANIFRGVAVLIAGPFYPPEAKDRGLSDSQIGFVFGSLDFSTFCCCLFFGKIIIPKLGPRLVLKLSIANLGVCTLLFGCLDLIRDKNAYLALSFVLRVLMGAGDAGCYPSAFTIFAEEFPSSVSTAIGVFEFLFGIGAILGPIVFGSFYDSVGFQVVYSIEGCLLLLSAVLMHFCVPKPIPPEENAPEEHSAEELTRDPRRTGRRWFHLLTIPPLLLIIANFFTASASIGFITGTLETHLEQFELSTFQTSAVFIVSNTIYTLLTPLWGLISDREILSRNSVLTVGCALITIGYGFLGPLPFASEKSFLWTTLVGLTLHGIGLGAAVTSSFPQAVHYALKDGFPSTERTFSLLSSLYSMTFALGNSVGPSVSGVLVDSIGFQKGTLFIVGMGVIVIISSGTLKCYRHLRRTV